MEKKSALEANLNRLKALPEPGSKTERAYQADILKAASMVDLEAHRLLTLIRKHYSHGDLLFTDARDLVEALNRAGEILRRQRQSLSKPSQNSTDTS